MKKTKQKILDQARRLFNDLGYSQVTIRMIAAELSMSSGNLNYHFRKREDILEALYFEMVEVFDRRIQGLEDQKLSLELMRSDVQSSMVRMVDYRFFWTDLYYILKSNQKIKAHFEEAKQARMDGYYFTFDSLISQKIIKPASFPKEYAFLMERMIDYSNTWIYSSVLYENEKRMGELIEKASFQLLTMLYPFLTDSGREEFRRLYPAFLAK